MSSDKKKMIEMEYIGWLYNMRKKYKMSTKDISAIVVTYMNSKTSEL